MQRYLCAGSEGSGRSLHCLCASAHDTPRHRISPPPRQSSPSVSLCEPSSLRPPVSLSLQEGVLPDLSDPAQRQHNKASFRGQCSSIFFAAGMPVLLGPVTGSGRTLPLPPPRLPRPRPAGNKGGLAGGAAKRKSRKITTQPHLRTRGCRTGLAKELCSAAGCWFPELTHAFSSWALNLAFPRSLHLQLALPCQCRVEMFALAVQAKRPAPMTHADCMMAGSLGTAPPERLVRASNRHHRPPSQEVQERRHPLQIAGPAVG